MNYKSKQDFLDNLHSKFSNEKEFLQAVEEVIGSIWDTVQQSQDYLDANILDRIVTPERVIIFRVPWLDDNGSVHVNFCLLYTSPSPRDATLSRMPSSA